MADFCDLFIVTFVIIINLFSFITDILKLIMLLLDFFLDFFTRAFKISISLGYTYLIKNFNELPFYRTSENFLISQFKLDAFVDINDKEKA